MTIIEFVSISGIRSIGIFISEKIPNIATATKIKAVVMGFFTADSYKLIFLNIYVST